MNKLIIDTTDREQITIKIHFGEKLDELTETAKPKTQATLLLIDKLLKKNNFAPVDIDEIVVNTGPGSFTGTRVGVAIANALGFGLNAPVNGSKSKIATPKYF